MGNYTCKTYIVHRITESMVLRTKFYFFNFYRFRIVVAQKLKEEDMNNTKDKLKALNQEHLDGKKN